MKIVETTAGSVTSTKQFIWSGESMKEARDSSGALTSQYFSQGQISSGSSYFYQQDHRGDIVGVANSSGAPVSSIAFDAYGRSTLLSGSFTPDFGFTGLYLHQRSGLNLAVYRAYDSTLGRWINRDPIAEKGGIALYAYAAGNPLTFVDPAGLDPDNPFKSIYQTPGGASRSGASTTQTPGAGKHTTQPKYSDCSRTCQDGSPCQHVRGRNSYTLKYGTFAPCVCPEDPPFDPNSPYYDPNLANEAGFKNENKQADTKEQEDKKINNLGDLLKHVQQFNPFGLGEPK